MNTYTIRHHTIYRYEAPVAVSHHVARLKPISNGRQTLQSFDISVDPTPEALIERIDFFGNTLHQFSLQKSHHELAVLTESEVTVDAPGAPLLDIAATCAEVRETLREPKTPEAFEALQFTHASPQVPVLPELHALAQKFLTDDGHYLGGVLALADYIYRNFEFDPTATDVMTPVQQVLKIKRGVCQDFAHLAIACIRSLGLPVRYASGYILTDPPEGQPRLEGADASHAWISIYDPDLGWIDIDPTNNLICDEQHIVIGYGRDYQDVSLVRGAMTGGGRHIIEVAVTVVPKLDALV
ncbi:transglutaminase family protein [Cerasicoccus maritimus]|uniref:transglutaminase family protein n=1 Tax=Cerasicoccus maritimus TaxID=490089 RepID=UPI0028528F08|nr:transglutaminase family protein [Cerasicoccus maritimus]